MALPNSYIVTYKADEDGLIYQGNHVYIPLDVMAAAAIRRYGEHRVRQHGNLLKIELLPEDIKDRVKTRK